MPSAGSPSSSPNVNLGTRAGQGCLPACRQAGAATGCFLLVVAKEKKTLPSLRAKVD